MKNQFKNKVRFTISYVSLKQKNVFILSVTITLYQKYQVKEWDRFYTFYAPMIVSLQIYYHFHFSKK